MAEEGTLAVRADVLEECGVNANATYTAEAYTNKFIKKAEGIICAATRYDWKTNYADVSTVGKEALRDCVSAYAATKCIKMDMSGFSSRQEALIMINILWAQYRETLDLLLKDNKYKDFIKTATGEAVD
jgi:hypothetical protein